MAQRQRVGGRRTLLSRAALLGFVGLALWLVRSGIAGRALSGPLAAPDAAVLMLVTGILLIYAEFNVPGSVVPGAAGALLVMFGVYELSRMSLCGDALLLVVAGAGLVLLAVRGSLGWAVAGVAMMALGFRGLIESGAKVHLPVALGASVSLAAATVWLGRVALLARRRKQFRGGPALAAGLASPKTAPIATAQRRLDGDRSF